MDRGSALLQRSTFLAGSSLTVVVLALSVSLSNAQAAPVLDQSFTSPGNASAVINECCEFVAQTFTAGRTGLLAGINIDVAAEIPGRLHVAIRTAADRKPTATVLGDTLLDSSSAPLSQLITFPQQIAVVAGVQYAIVVNYDVSGLSKGVWDGAIGDAYPRGALLAFDGLDWFAEPGFDVHFQTFVTPNVGPPDCSGVSARPASIWPPSHKFRLIGLGGATDPDGDPVTLTVTAVTQDEPVRGFGAGDKSPDARASTQSDHMFLRAERSGRGDGRVYRVSFTGSSGEGGTCSGTVPVGVPRNMRPGSTPYDSAPPSFNSFAR